MWQVCCCLGVSEHWIGNEGDEVLIRAVYTAAVTEPMNDHKIDPNVMGPRVA